MGVCPHCESKPRYPEGFPFLVCSGCAEILYVNELVT